MMITSAANSHEPSPPSGEMPKYVSKKFRYFMRWLEAAYSAFLTAVSKCPHAEHWNVCSSKPGRSGSIPISNIAVPHSEQLGRTIALE
jgi:hypothetical protein